MKPTDNKTKKLFVEKNGCPKQLSKLGLAHRNGKLKGLVIELTDDPWNLK